MSNARETHDELINRLVGWQLRKHHGEHTRDDSGNGYAKAAHAHRLCIIHTFHPLVNIVRDVFDRQILEQM
jgi:hypothetical protein